MPLWPVWNSAGTPAASITSYRGYTARSFGKKPCEFGWNLKPRTPWSESSRFAAANAGGAARRVDARERDQHVGVRGGRLRDLLVGDRRRARDRLAVDAEDDRDHVPLAVVGGHVIDGRQPVAAEVPAAPARSSGDSGSSPVRETSACVWTSIASIASTSNRGGMARS